MNKDVGTFRNQNNYKLPRISVSFREKFHASNLLFNATFSGNLTQPHLPIRQMRSGGTRKVSWMVGVWGGSSNGIIHRCRGMNN